MAYSLRCADTGTDCPAAFTAATEPELMEHITLHASQAHPEMDLTPDIVEQIKSLVRIV
jgi:predicted small metal-binding protein